MRSITAVIASALASCASRAVLARLSAPTVTQARSGARFTTASPLVTITAGGGPGGWGCGCAATGSAAVIRNTTASVSFIPYLSAYSAYRGRMPRPLQRTCDTESDRIGIGVGRQLVAMAARQHPHVGDEPAAAADEAQVADRRSRRISGAGGAVIARVVPVVDPFPDVPRHVEQAVAIRRIRAARRRAVRRLERGVDQEVRHVAVEAVSPRISFGLRAAPCSLLPLGLGRQTEGLAGGG